MLHGCQHLWVGQHHARPTQLAPQQRGQLVRRDGPIRLFNDVPRRQVQHSRRLHRRATDQEEDIQGRLQKAREEYRQIPNYDYMVVNDKVSEAAAEIIAILTAESCRTKHRINLVEGV